MPEGSRHAYSQRFGLKAETIAALWLRLKGYRILSKRFRASGAEIDLVARRGAMIAFVEVKARPDPDAALAAVTPEKARQISRAARNWLARYPQPPVMSFRLDAVIVSRRMLPRHVEAVLPLAID